jgi:hypothetical protein
VQDKKQRLTLCLFEVASWFECLLKTMKIYAAHTHAVDDHTEAIFSAIERERGLDVKRAVVAVSTILRSKENLPTDGVGLSDFDALAGQCIAALTQ